MPAPLRLRSIYIGGEFNLLFNKKPLEDLTNQPLTLFLDAPDRSKRITLRYLNGGTDGALESMYYVRFYKTPQWTIDNLLLPGQEGDLDWTVGMATGTIGVNLYVVKTFYLPVCLLPGGVLPVS